MFEHERVRFKEKAVALRQKLNLLVFQERLEKARKAEERTENKNRLPFSLSDGFLNVYDQAMQIASGPHTTREIDSYLNRVFLSVMEEVGYHFLSTYYALDKSAVVLSPARTNTFFQDIHTMFRPPHSMVIEQQVNQQPHIRALAIFVPPAAKERIREVSLMERVDRANLSDIYTKRPQLLVLTPNGFSQDANDMVTGINNIPLAIREHEMILLGRYIMRSYQRDSDTNPLISQHKRTLVHDGIASMIPTSSHTIPLACTG